MNDNENGLEEQEGVNESRLTEKDDANEMADDKIVLLENELKAEKDKCLRLFAEFENFKKRTTKERIDLFKTANKEVVTAVLPVLDDFKRALTQLDNLEEVDTSWTEGVYLIYNKLLDVLNNQGLQALEVNIGDRFDTDFHEAITQIASPDEEMKGKVIDVIEGGYTLNDKVIRYAKVVVAN